MLIHLAFEIKIIRHNDSMKIFLSDFFEVTV